MFGNFLFKFTHITEKNPLVFSGEQLATYPQKEVSTLKYLGLLKKAAPAKTVECPGCEEACLMPVHVFPAQDERPARLFVACYKREDTGRILIEPAALEQWQIDISRFASLLASALGTNYNPDEIISQQTFYLGSLTVKRKRRSAIFITNYESLNLTLESGIVEQYPYPFFLVATGLPGPQEVKQGMEIPLQHLLLSSEDELRVDISELEDLLSIRSRARQDVIPITVPKGTEWNHIFISFVNEQTVQIRYAGNTEYRSFDEMGFSDMRKAVSKENQPSLLWGIFFTFAKYHGEMIFQDSINEFSDPKKVKKWVSQIRKKLEVVFPNIPGDPFHPYNKVKGYKTRFFLNAFPSSM